MTYTKSETPIEEINKKFYLAYDDVAKMLGVTTRTIQRYIVYGWIRPVSITGRTKIITRTEFEKFIQLAADKKLPPPGGWPNTQSDMEL